MLENSRRITTFELNMIRIFRLTGAGIIVAIWVLSLLPLNQMMVPGGDKLHHFIAYGSLMLVWALATPRHSMRQHALMAGGFMAMGLAVECAQGLTPYRFFEWADALANALGVMGGWVLAMFASRMPIFQKVK